jgi:hypothetical protein
MFINVTLHIIEYNVYISTKFHLSGSNGLLVTAIKYQSKENFHTASIIIHFTNSQDHILTNVINRAIELSFM